jgi:HEAT repeat protein
MSRDVVDEALRLAGAGDRETAVELLHEAGYGPQASEEARRAYEELVPVHPVLCERLAGPLAALRDPSPAVRLRAAREIAREAMKETTSDRHLWINDPRGLAPVIDALDDADPRVAEKALVTMSQVGRWFSRDWRAYPGVARLLGSTRANTRFWAVSAAALLFPERAGELLPPLLADRSAKVRAEVIRNVLELERYERLTPKVRRALFPAVVAALTDEDGTVRNRTVNVLRQVYGADAADVLAARLPDEPDDAVRANIAESLAAVRQP